MKNIFFKFQKITYRKNRRTRKCSKNVRSNSEKLKKNYTMFRKIWKTTIKKNREKTKKS